MSSPSMLSPARSKRSRSATEPSIPAVSHPSLGNDEIPSDLLRCLRETRLVDDSALSTLLSLMYIRRLASGDLVIREGSMGRSIFILLQGQVVVSSEVCESEIGELGPGNVLGEIGGLLDVPRTMTVRAKGYGCTLGVVMREDVVKVPGLIDALLNLAKSRLKADEARERRLMMACPTKLTHLASSYERIFGEKPNKNNGKFIKRADQWILLLTEEAVRISVVEGGVRVRSAASGNYVARYAAGEQFQLEHSDEPKIIQAVGKTCIFAEFLNLEETTKTDDASGTMTHTDSKDTFAAAVEQATRLSKIIASNTYRRSSIAVWSDETFLRPISHAGSDERRSRMASAPALPKIVERNMDVVALMDQMGVPAEAHRSKILASHGDGSISVNLEPIHQYFDNELLEAVLILSGESIKSLCLNDCWTLSDAALHKVALNCHKLTSLRISNCWSLTEAGLKLAIEDFPETLRDLEIKGCAGMTDAALFSISNLNSLDLSYCKNIGDGCWDGIKKLAPMLQSLTLRRCTKISGEGIVEAMKVGDVVFKQMRHLDLMDCSFLSDEAICALVAACPHLEHLNISFCQDLDVSIFEKLAKANPSGSLKELLAEHCSGFITDENVEVISRHWPRLSGFFAKGANLLSGKAVQALATLSHLKQVDLSSCPLIDYQTLTKTALQRSWVLINPPNIFG